MFPPKGKKPGDLVLVQRSPVETRPLKCKNHDNKVLSGERNFAIAKNIRQYASELQNGFIKGRNFLCNVVGIDAFARFASFSEHWQFMPLIILFDLMSAFPRVAHHWLFLSLKAAGADFKLINFIYAIYNKVRVFVNDGMDLAFAFFAKSGVLQGCPLSASLFVIAINPFLVNLNKVLVEASYGVLYACADDLGSALLRFSALHSIYTIFFKSF